MDNKELRIMELEIEVEALRAEVETLRELANMWRNYSHDCQGVTLTEEAQF